MKILKQYDEYRKFTRLRKLRSILSSIIVMIFWYFMINANNPETEKDVFWLLISILTILTFSIVYFVYMAFLKKPHVLKGQIISSRNKKRTVKRAGDVENRVIKEYLVKTNQGECWGRNIASYIGGEYKEMQVGEKVIWFSYGKGNSYIVHD